jgi:hypothetical protein
VTTCEECKRFGYSRTNQVSYPCALCGELRCMDHMIWVPAHELEKPYKEAEAITSLLKHKKVGGYYGFCGRSSHVPRGLSIRHGKEREGGKMVRLILDHEKKTGLECFQRWEVGAVENGYETTWELKRYALSCSFAPIMMLIANMFLSGKDPSSFLERLYDSAFRVFGGKKQSFFFEVWEDFVKSVGSKPEKDTLIKYTCSRCSVIPCLNRQAPFYDKKLLKKIAQEPEFHLV